jgi:hypothetical protein
VSKASELVGELSLMKFFPADENARVALVRIVCEMAENDDQVRWLVRRMLNLYNEWPGPRELRACFCSKFRPADGIHQYSSVYLDGIPSERATAPQLPAAPMRQIQPPITDAKVQRAVQVLTAKAQRMPAARNGSDAAAGRLREILTAPCDRPELPGPTPQIITQEDVRREVEKLRIQRESTGTR